jgi:hypothetical protein
MFSLQLFPQPQSVKWNQYISNGMETLRGKAKWMGGISRRSGMDTKILIKIGTAADCWAGRRRKNWTATRRGGREESQVEGKEWMKGRNGNGKDEGKDRGVGDEEKPPPSLGRSHSTSQ